MRDRIAKIRGDLFRLTCSMLHKNIKVEKGLRIYKRLSIEGKGKVYIGRDCIIEGIKGDSSQYVTIETIHRNAVVRIGYNVRLYAARISCKYEVSVGNGVVIEGSGIQDTHFHTIDQEREDPSDENMENSRVEILDNVVIGIRASVLKGVTVGSGAVIMPGTVVNRSIPKDATVIGNPARLLRKTD